VVHPIFRTITTVFLLGLPGRLRGGSQVSVGQINPPTLPGISGRGLSCWTGAARLDSHHQGHAVPAAAGLTATGTSTARIDARWQQDQDHGPAALRLAPPPTTVRLALTPPRRLGRGGRQP
jgi:hypothetical protein